MEVRPEFKKVADQVSNLTYGLAEAMNRLRALHGKYKDDDLVQLLFLANNLRVDAYGIYHWLYEEHREERLAYDNEICSQISDFQHD